MKARLKWSNRVTKESNALDLEHGVFSKTNPLQVAESLKDSAEKSNRRKASPFQSAMSMLNFYINRAGKNLKQSQLLVLQEAKKELRRLFNK
jgi:hypothetical protein